MTQSGIQHSRHPSQAGSDPSPKVRAYLQLTRMTNLLCNSVPGPALQNIISSQQIVITGF